MTSPPSHMGFSSNYERMSGGCTKLIASQMVSNVSPPIDSSSYILDNACGPGIVSQEIKSLHPDAKILATDLSPAMIEEVQRRIKTEWWSNVKTDVLDVRDLASLPDDTFTHVFTNLGMQVGGDMESPVKAVKEIFRVLKPGGVSLSSTWADRIWLNAFYNTARSIRPGESPQKSMALEPIQLRGSWLAKQLEDGGFANNFEVRSCLTYTSAERLDELADNMILAKQMFFAGYSDEELERAKLVFKEELRKLRTFEEVDGGIRIGMKAWIGIGWKRGDENEIPV